MGLDLVQQIRGTYPTPFASQAQHLDFLQRTARAHGLGLVRKTSGNRLTDFDVSLDVLMNAGGTFAVDVLRDAEGAQEPAWRELAAEERPSADRCVPVEAEPPGPEPPPETLDEKVDRVLEILERHFK